MELLDLYARRREIELRLRDVKGTLGTVRVFEARYRGCQRHHCLRRRIHAQLLGTVADKILDFRPGRHGTQGPQTPPQGLPEARRPALRLPRNTPQMLLPQSRLN